MNRLIDNIFEKDLFVRILSVLIALLLWFMVLDLQNPFEERAVSVPLRTNMEQLNSMDLKIVSSEIPLSVDIIIKGRRDRLNKVSSNDFEVMLDFSKISDSTVKELYINQPIYNGEEDIIIAQINPSKVKVKLERIVSKEFPVELELLGELEDGYGIINKTYRPTSIKLEGLESQITLINKVVSRLNFEQVDYAKDLYNSIVFLDKGNKPVVGFNNNTNVIVNYDYTKQVPIKASVSGIPDSDAYFDGLAITKGLALISGKMSDLKEVEYITASPVDISGRNESFTTPLNILLSDKYVMLEKSESFLAEVNIKKYEHRVVRVEKENITLTGSISDEYKYNIIDKYVDVELVGKKQSIDATGDVVKAYANVSNLKEGLNKVALFIKLPDDVGTNIQYSVMVEKQLIQTEQTNNEIDENNETDNNINDATEEDGVQ